MTQASIYDAGWMARVGDAGVRVELWDADLDDHGFELLSDTILDAVREATLSDDDLYPLLVRLWNGRLPLVDWPPHAPAIARRCATELATRAACEPETWTHAPTDRSLKAARDVIVADLRLTPSELLSAVADHWEHLAGLQMPTSGGCSLLAFARHVLLEPVVGACALVWSTLDSMGSNPEATGTFAWGEWSPVPGDNWSDVVSAELARLGQPPRRVPDNGDEASAMLASARAALLEAHDTTPIAASIVRTSGWPGDASVIAPIARRAVDRAKQHIDDVDTETDNDELVDSIQRRLVPSRAILIGWARDASFGSLSDPGRSSRTGAEMLHEAADRLTWSVARAAVEVVAAKLRPLKADA